MQLFFDRFAIALSSICALHCVALPLVAGLIPLLATTIYHGSTLHEFWFHQFILLFILPVSIVALIAGRRCHKKYVPILIAATGLFILVFNAIFAEDLIDRHILSHSAEVWLAIIGGIIHAIGHLLNVAATRKTRVTCSVQ